MSGHHRHGGTKGISGAHVADGAEETRHDVKGFPKLEARHVRVVKRNVGTPPGFHGKQIRTLVNGDVRQDGNTDEMKWDMHYLVADIARTITLQSGDVLMSGTPAISRTVYPGDVVEVEVEGLGTLRNHIVEGPTPIRTDVGAQPTESEEVLSTAKGGDWEFRGVRKPDLSNTH